jgi:HEAT repeat protein
MASPAFERFRFSFFEDENSARDGLATSALAELDGDEAAEAESMLIGYLPDMRAAIGLGVLRSRRAEAELTQMFDTGQQAQREAKAANGEFRSTDGLVYLAKALWQIRPDRRWLDAMLDVLASGDGTQRQTAAEQLRGVRDPAAVPALIKAIDDDEPLVRHHAARRLLDLHGLPTGSWDPAHMMFRVMSKDAARREGGKRDVLAVIDGRPIAD